MVVDPQQFNAYVYTRNNPIKWIDPEGTDVRIRGANTINALYEMAGGQEEFDKYFVVTDGVLAVRPDVDIGAANSGVQNLAGLVKAPETYLFYVGNDFREIADLFNGATNSRGELTNLGRRYRDEFEGSSPRRSGVGILVAVRGRPLGKEPGTLDNAALFAVIAYNEDALIVQTGLSSREHWEPFPSGRIPALGSQLSGIGQQVRASSFFIHEGAEAKKFKEIGFADRLGNNNYFRAHRHAIMVEAKIREELKITGGFAGGSLHSTMPRRR